MGRFCGLSFRTFFSGCGFPKPLLAKQRLSRLIASGSQTFPPSATRNALGLGPSSKIQKCTNISGPIVGRHDVHWIIGDHVKDFHTMCAHARLRTVCSKKQFQTKLIWRLECGQNQILREQLQEPKERRLAAVHKRPNSSLILPMCSANTT